MQQKIKKHIGKVSQDELNIKRWDLANPSSPFYQAMFRKYPLNEKYYFELNPSFVYEYPSYEMMFTLPFVMIRDGFYGILLFFLKNPKPPVKCETTILVPAMFQKLVPKMWQGHVLIYDYIYKQEEIANKKVVIYGNVSRENFVDTDVKSFLKTIPKADEYVLVSPLRDYGFLPGQNEGQLCVEFQKEIYKNFGFDVKTFQQFRVDHLNFVDKKYAYKNIDSDHFLIFDDYLNHFFASVGAANLNQRTCESEMINATIINMSPYHQIRIGEIKEYSDFLLQLKVEAKLKNIPLNPLSELYYDFAFDSFRNY